MLPLVTAVAALASLAAGSPAPEARAAAPVVARRAAPRLDVRLALDPGPAALAVAPQEKKDRTAPPCVADFCQARVDVPGFGPSVGKAHKTELVVALLDRANLEPFASIAWFFVVTGLRVDWTPANLDTSFGATAGGWGNVFVRLRLRVDAWNRPAVPVRPKERTRQARELAEERAREQRRDVAAQRPARLSST